MSAHLAGDSIITSALVSHNVFNWADGLTRWALGNEAFSTDDRVRLFAGVEAMLRKDPFGYVAAIRDAREEILKRLRFSGDAWAKAGLALGRCDGDRLLYLLVVFDETSETPDLGDVISLEGLATARGSAERTRKIIKETEDVQAAFARGSPVIGNVNERQASARGDLRRAYFALQK
jgi:hypothetical protein